MKYLSLFSGIGGFELGINQAYEKNLDNRRATGSPKLAVHNDKPNANASDGDGWRSNPTCIGYSEIDKYAIQIYEKHFNHKSYGDITKIDERSLPDFDLLVGGFPCQAFSIAGKRGGFEDTRGTLFFDIARIVKKKQPRLLLLENVKGLLSHDKGATFLTIITTLDELGYDCEWQVLNSKNFGVPQNRERVFIIGHLRGSSGRKVFPLGESNKTSDEYNEQGAGVRSREVSNAIDANYYKGAGGKRQMISKTIRSGGQKSPHGSKQNWDSYEVDGKIRRLTPTECERLQGFPDGWTDGVSDTQRYKTLGNAVTVNVIQAIIEKLFAIQTEIPIPAQPENDPYHPFLHCP